MGLRRIFSSNLRMKTGCWIKKISTIEVSINRWNFKNFGPFLRFLNFWIILETNREERKSDEKRRKGKFWKEKKLFNDIGVEKVRVRKSSFQVGNLMFLGRNRFRIVWELVGDFFGVKEVCSGLALMFYKLELLFAHFLHIRQQGSILEEPKIDPWRSKTTRIDP